VFARARAALGTVADLIQIGLLVLLIGGSLAAALIWVRDEEVPAWAFAIMAATFVVALPIGYVLGRRSWWRLRRDASERVRDELKLATTYLSQVDDSLFELREAFT
jgi:hypothetical protein